LLQLPTSRQYEIQKQRRDVTDRKIINAVEMQNMRRKGEENEDLIGCAAMTSMGNHIRRKGKHN
jgi:hypothetical protein